MKNFISWFEIPSTDFTRAVKFYKQVLGIEITEIDMHGTKMGLFPGDGKNVSGAIVNGDDYKPSGDGVMIYLNAGEDLQPTLDRVKKHGGTVIVPKTMISPEMGHFAIFLDPENNKMALHSIH